MTEKQTRGGYQKRKKFTYGPSILLSILWNKYGGVKLLSEKTGIKSQNFHNWKQHGKVSLKYVNKLVNVMRVPIEALNPVDLPLFTGKNYDWEKTVKSCKLTEEEQKIVLKGTYPKEVDL